MLHTGLSQPLEKLQVVPPPGYGSNSGRWRYTQSAGGLSSGCCNHGAAPDMQPAQRRSGACRSWDSLPKLPAAALGMCTRAASTGSMLRSRCAAQHFRHLEMSLIFSAADVHLPVMQSHARYKQSTLVVDQSCRVSPAFTEDDKYTVYAKE